MTATLGAPGLALVHSIAGRLRLRLTGAVDSTAVVSAVEALAGIVSVVWSARTRSLLVHYHPDAVDADTIVETVAVHAGVDLRANAPESADAPPAAVPPQATMSPVVTAIQQTMREFDVAVRRRTAGLLDVGILFPLALGAWAALELLRGRVGPLAWSSALWYAHGLFRDYSLPDTEG